ncbi:DEAD/DEAH box helicase [Achromobacter xylosoxidans]|uniref:DEAD/DEAH box helicase n=1 Tax=Alcaligenes xylosoxydans xylosoxydans TaxID=85698 RepID=UPI0022B8768E|nr:DEAD/DEAH box helicase [Achromobacter xylosoxidans]MCZ8391588.1 DEAD/DEAH box helicase [Achromobacter xylosoxidans]
MQDVPLRWTVEALQYVDNRVRARQAFSAAMTNIKYLRKGGIVAATEILGKLGEDSPLDEHQVVNVAAMTLPGASGLCLFDEQGAGKTVSMIYAFDELVRRDEVDFMLIAAPKSMVGEWPKDFARFTHDLYRVATVSGSPGEKRKALASRADVLVTNFETVVSLEAQFDALLRSYGGRSVIAVDESFFIKSPDARRTMALRRLREWSARGFVLCGTPAPNSPADVVQQFNFADFGLAFENVEVPDDRSQALPVVQNVINDRGLYIRNLKIDVLPDLPAKAFEHLLVDLQPQQRELYVAALQALVEDLLHTSDTQFRRSITNFLSQRAMLLQLCSNPAAAAEGYDETPAKMLALDRIVQKYVVEQNEKVVIWSFYTATIDAIMARYANYGAVRYDGTVSSVEDRRNAVTRFQTDNATRIFVANPAAAGAGLTLHSARIAVYESMSNQAAHYLQSLDRIHRRGQERSVEYVILLCRDTIEEAEYQRLLNKEASAQELLGDDVQPPPLSERPCCRRQ